jgi:adenylate cyclase
MTLSKSTYFFFLFSLFFLKLNSQDQNEIDSLKQVYKSNRFDGLEKMELLELLGFHETNDLESALIYSDELIQIAKVVDSMHYIYEGYLNKGNTYRLLGDVDKALVSLFKSSEAGKKSDPEDEAASYIAIADVYSEMGNSEKC